MNKTYIMIVTILTIILRVASFAADHFITRAALSFDVFSKWFIFSAVGLRLFLAGIWQITKPEFTA